MGFVLFVVTRAQMNEVVCGDSVGHLGDITQDRMAGPHSLVRRFSNSIDEVLYVSREFHECP
jgi:hypothetical protein